MPEALYYKDGSTFKQLAIGGSGGATVDSTTTVLSSDSASGATITVPTHTVGGKHLQVYIDGLLCSEGTSAQYVDKTATTIQLNDGYEQGTEIKAVVTK